MQDKQSLISNQQSIQSSATAQSSNNNSGHTIIDKKMFEQLLNELGYDDMQYNEPLDNNEASFIDIFPSSAYLEFKRLHNALISQGLVHEEILELGSSPNGHVILKALVESNFQVKSGLLGDSTLQTFLETNRVQFAKKDIYDLVKKCENSDYSNLLQAVIKYTQALVEKGFTGQQIVDMALKPNGNKVLPGVLQHVDQFLKLNFSIDEINNRQKLLKRMVKLAFYSDSSFILTQFIESYNGLREKNCSDDEIMQAVTASSLLAASNLKALCDRYGLHDIRAAQQTASGIYLDATADHITDPTITEFNIACGDSDEDRPVAAHDSSTSVDEALIRNNQSIPSASIITNSQTDISHQVTLLTAKPSSSSANTSANKRKATNEASEVIETSASLTGNSSRHEDVPLATSGPVSQKKRKITDAKEFKKLLLNLGYSEELISRTVKADFAQKKSSLLDVFPAEGYEDFERCHKELTAQRFTKEEIVTLAADKKGYVKLAAVAKYYNAITGLLNDGKKLGQFMEDHSLKLTKYQIMDILKLSDNENNLEGLVENFEQLITLGFTTELIVTMLKNRRSKTHLRDAIFSFKEVQKLNLPEDIRNNNKKVAELIARILNHRSAGYTLAFFITNYNTLKQKFDHGTIMSVFNYSEPKPQLEKLLVKSKEIVANDHKASTGSEPSPKVSDNLDSSKSSKANNISSKTSDENKNSKITTSRQFKELLLKLGYTEELITRQIKETIGPKRPSFIDSYPAVGYELFESYHRELKAQDFSLDDIAILAADKHGHKKLEKVVKLYDGNTGRLKGDKLDEFMRTNNLILTRQQVIEVMKRSECHHNLDGVVQYFEQLISAGFSIEHIVSIAKNRASPNRLSAALLNFEKIKNLNLPEEIKNDKAKIAEQIAKIIHVGRDDTLSLFIKKYNLLRQHFDHSTIMSAFEYTKAEEHVDKLLKKINESEAAGESIRKDPPSGNVSNQRDKAPNSQVQRKRKPSDEASTSIDVSADHLETNSAPVSRSKQRGGKKVNTRTVRSSNLDSKQMASSSSRAKIQNLNVSDEDAAEEHSANKAKPTKKRKITNAKGFREMLLDLGYSEELITRQAKDDSGHNRPSLLEAFPIEGYAKFEEWHKELTAQKFTLDEIVTLAADKKGHVKLDRVCKLYNGTTGLLDDEKGLSEFMRRQQLVLTKQQIVEIMKKSASEQNLDGVVEYFEQLIARKFTVEQIISIARNSNSTNRLKAAVFNFEKIKELNIPTEIKTDNKNIAELIVRIINHGPTAEALSLFMKTYHVLRKKYDHNKIMEIFDKKRPKKHIESLLKSDTDNSKNNDSEQSDGSDDSQQANNSNKRPKSGTMVQASSNNGQKESQVPAQSVNNKRSHQDNGSQLMSPQKAPGQKKNNDISFSANTAEEESNQENEGEASSQEQLQQKKVPAASGKDCRNHSRVAYFDTSRPRKKAKNDDFVDSDDSDDSDYGLSSDSVSSSQESDSEKSSSSESQQAVRAKLSNKKVTENIDKQPSQNSKKSSTANIMQALHMRSNKAMTTDPVVVSKSNPARATAKINGPDGNNIPLADDNHEEVSSLAPK